MNGGLTIIRNMYESLTPTEKKIADCILECPREVVNSTVSELARMSNTSDAAVIRLCKSLQIKGFSELKLKVAGDLRKPQEEQYYDILPEEKVEDLIQKVSNNNIQAIRETMEVVHPNEIKRAIEAIIHGKHLMFYGVGASAIIAQDAEQKFLRINKRSSSYTDFHVAAVAATNTTEEDVLFGISFSGETREVAEVMELAKKNKAKIISLTKLGKSMISDLADIRLFTPASIESPLRSAATSSRMAQLNIIDILFSSVASQNYEETINYLKRTREAIRSHKI